MHWHNDLWSTFFSITQNFISILINSYNNYIPIKTSKLIRKLFECWIYYYILKKKSPKCNIHTYIFTYSNERYNTKYFINLLLILLSHACNETSQSLLSNIITFMILRILLKLLWCLYNITRLFLSENFNFRKRSNA